MFDGFLDINEAPVVNVLLHVKEIRPNLMVCIYLSMYKLQQKAWQPMHMLNRNKTLLMTLEAQKNTSCN